MEYFRYIVRFLYRIRWYLVVLPLIALVIAWFMTRNMDKEYDVKTTIYTGIISGYNLETGSTIAVGNSFTNMANLMNIITTEKTLKEVSLRLYVECMTYGDEEKSTNYITAEHFRELNAMTPKEIKALIDKKNEAKSVENLKAYERPSANNFVYALLNGGHPYFSVPLLSEKIKVAQLGNSDMIEIGYSANDPGIAYNTLRILNEEFIDQYQEIRFGETNDVIKFFEGEVARLFRVLTNSENELIKYNVDKRIINYGEQTKQVAILDATQQLKENDLLFQHATTSALINFLEAKLGDQAKLIRSNNDFIDELNKISSLKAKISNLEIMNESGNAETNAALSKNKDEMMASENKISKIAQEIIAASSSTNNVQNRDLVDKWLEQVILSEKTQAEAGATDVMRANIDRNFLYFAPIGATINRKERHIGFVESNYMAMLNALNAARLRQKNLQMTTATLKVLNPPLFPLNALPTNRLLILLAAYLLTFLFTCGYFAIIELLDHTLRDRQRAEKLTGGKVLGAFPKESSLRYRRYNKAINDMAMRHLSKTLLPYFKEGQQNVINLLSTEEGNGKSMLASQLEEYWNSIGLEVRKIAYDEDFLTEDSKYVMANSVKDLCPDLQPNEILIVEYPNLSEHSISPALLNMGTVNLLVSRANRAWKNTDQQMYKKLMDMLDNKEDLFIYLTQADRSSVEEFTGQLPPYTPFKNFVYRMSQLGLTAVENKRAK